MMTSTLKRIGVALIVACLATPAAQSAERRRIIMLDAQFDSSAADGQTP